MMNSEGGGGLRVSGPNGADPRSPEAGKFADRLGAIGFVLALSAIVGGLGNQVWFAIQAASTDATGMGPNETLFDGILVVFVIVAVVATISAFAALRLGTRRRALAGAAIGIGLASAAVPVTLVVATVVIQALSAAQQT